MKRLLSSAALLGVLALVGCTPVGPSFAETCAKLGGEVLEDSTTKLVTGVITGTVVGSNGSVGTGTGVATSPVTITVRLCIADGRTLDMEVD